MTRLNHELSFFSWKALTKFVVALVIFSGSVHAQTQNPATSPAPATVQAEQEYKACLVRARSQLTPQEKKDLSQFSQKLFYRMLPYRSKPGTDAEEAYRKALLAFLQKELPDSISERLFPRLHLAIESEKLLRRMDMNASAKGVTYGRYSQYVQVSLRGGALNMGEFEKTHFKLAQQITAHHGFRPDDKTTRPEDLPPEMMGALAQLNLVSQAVAALQVENAAIAKDRRRFYWSLGQQAAYGIAGFGAIIGTIVLGPLAVARGGAMAASMGLHSLTGGVAGGVSIGALGGPGNEAFRYATVTMGSSYISSLHNGTPWRCELQREISQASPGSNLALGLAGGGSAGTIGVIAAHFLPRSILLLTGASVAVGFSYEMSLIGYEAMKARQYYQLANELESLPHVPSHLKMEHELLTLIAWNEFYQRSKTIVEHGANAAIIATLVKPFFRDGDFMAAYRHGMEKVKGLMTYSADTIPSVGLATADILHNVESLSPFAEGGHLTARKPDFPKQVRSFINRVKSSPTSDRILGLAVMDPQRVEWTPKPPTP